MDLADLSATLDRVKVLDGRDQKFKVGYISLQDHRDNKIEFRNLHVRPAVGLLADHEHRERAGSHPWTWAWIVGGCRRNGANVRNREVHHSRLVIERHRAGAR